MMASVLIVLSFLCGVRFVCRSNDSIIRKDYRPYGTLQHEFTYRQNILSSKNCRLIFMFQNIVLSLLFGTIRRQLFVLS